ncbi:hypothetical protein [Aminobacter sp. BE322]|uniref:hypothetical protein n=1 Tax=unclassified Aminobacter TaxID=2644704 RepID=UPI003D23D37D
MRSLTFRTSLAALLICTPLAAAYAASPHEPHFRSIERDDHGTDAAPLSTYVPGGQLSAVLNDLHDANARIVSDRKAKLITPAEARSLEAQVAAVRKAAVADAASGMIPGGEYRQLMARITGLDDQVGRDAMRG